MHLLVIFPKQKNFLTKLFKFLKSKCLFSYLAVSSVEKIISKCEDPELQDECHIDDGNLGTKYGLVCLAAQLAFERNQRDVAMVALKHLSDAPDVNKVAKLTAHRFNYIQIFNVNNYLFY